MVMKTDQQVHAGPWPVGMNNRQPDYAMPDGSLRNAVNVDIDVIGQISRRSGYERILEGVGLRGGCSCEAGTYFVQGSRLYSLTDENDAVEICDGIFGDEITYEMFNDAVYFSDSLVTKRVEGVVAYEWGLEVPSAPSVGATSGSLGVGTYVAAVTVVDSEGRESGASDTTSLELSSAGGITVSGLPTNSITRVYLSTANGSVMYLIAELAAGVTSFSVSTAGYDDGKEIDTQFMGKPPAGRIIRHYAGRMFIADGPTIWYTEPFSPDLVHRGRGFFQFTAPVVVMEIGEGGMWVVTDKTEFYAGTDPENYRASTKLRYGAVYGTSQKLPGSSDFIWYSTKGVVMAASNGEIVNLQEKNVATDSGEVGAAMYREEDGLRQMVVSIKDSVASPLAATSFLEMEVIRRAS